MGAAIRTILFNADEASAPELRQGLLSSADVRLVAELDEPSLLPQAAAQFPCEVIVAHLDPMAKVVMEVLVQVAAANPRLPIIAISDTTDGEILLRAMKAGLKGFLVKPLNVEELRGLLAQISADRVVTREPGKLVSVVGSAGGVGATILATNLAVEMAALVEGEHKVALLDFDFRFGQVATLLDLEPQFTVADLCSTPEQVDPEMVEKALLKHASGVSVLARPATFQQAECITAAHCANVITTLQEMFSYVIIDGPMRSDPGGRMILDAADYNLMVLQLLVTSVRNADRMVQELSAQGFARERIQYVCNRVGRESAYLEPAQVEQSLRTRLFHQLPDEWKTVSSAINVGRPLSIEAPRSRVRQAVRELAMKLHKPAASSETSVAGGLLGRLLGGRARPTRTPPSAAAALPAPA